MDVSPIRIKPEIDQHRTASPTTDIVDNLLGEVVHGRLTKDSLSSTSGRELSLGKVSAASIGNMFLLMIRQGTT